MADFCITAVRYNAQGEHIEFVKVCEEKADSLGLERIVSRAFVADLIRLGKATFQTRTEVVSGRWRIGATVHVIEDDYLTTDPNYTKRDNLGNLPLF